MDKKKSPWTNIQRTLSKLYNICVPNASVTNATNIDTTGNEVSKAFNTKPQPPIPA